MMANRKMKRFPLTVLTSLSAVFVLTGLADTKLQISRYSYISPKVPKRFDGYKILQISDLHSKSFGKKQSELLGMVGLCEPDIIVLTGDIIDEKQPGITSVNDLFAGLGGIPVFYVSGNHELRSAAKTHMAMLKDSMKRNRIMDIDNSCRKIKSRDNTDRINIYGLSFMSKHGAPTDRSGFNILLYHNCDRFDRISELGYDLVFSGHEHGGIVRLPLIGGLFGHGFSILPKYNSGMYTRGDSTLVCSRGLGGTALPRFFNPPELVLVTLYKGDCSLY